jgi:hypothetical protein
MEATTWCMANHQLVVQASLWSRNMEQAHSDAVLRRVGQSLLPLLSLLSLRMAMIMVPSSLFMGWFHNAILTCGQCHQHPASDWTYQSMLGQHNGAYCCISWSTPLRLQALIASLMVIKSLRSSKCEMSKRQWSERSFQVNQTCNEPITTRPVQLT